jgi:hypothetical protein
MQNSDADRYDRARVAAALVGAPDPEPPISGGYYPWALVALTAVTEWRLVLAKILKERSDKDLFPLPKPVASAEWARAYDALAGWQADPVLVGLLSDLPENPYCTEGNWRGFENGRATAPTSAGGGYRKYVQKCRSRAPDIYRAFVAEPEKQDWVRKKRLPTECDRVP